VMTFAVVVMSIDIEKSYDKQSCIVLFLINLY
jgi:hypothetical protein